MVLLIYGVRLPPLCQKPHINLLGRVTDQVFSESEEWDIDTVSETIASEYERATNLSINKEKQNLPIEEKRTIDVKEIREWLNFIITIISVVLGVTNSSATTINNYNYTQQVNNYYIVGMGYDAKELNTTKYRIVNRESIVRLKHIPCSLHHAASVRPLCLHSVTSSIHSSRERPGARFLLIMKPPNVVNFYILSSGV